MRSFISLSCAILCPLFFLRAQVSVDVLTQHNNISRTGWNNQDTILNTRNVKPGLFGKLFSCAVDDQLYAQPLVVTQVAVPGIGNRNIVYVATVSNSVYAFDADSQRAAGPYWQVSLNPTGTRPPKNSDMTGACSGNYKDFSGNIGIVGTPVIDKTAGTLYLVSRSFTTDGSAVFSQYLHAIDIRTGAEKAGSPVTITAQVSGSGAGSTGGFVPFDPQRENQRPGLLLLNGIVYIGYSGHCDWLPYHGWLLGYDATTLQQKIVYNVTPGGSGGGIWMSGNAPAADAAGNIFLGAGNGTAGVGSNMSDPTNRAESLLKLVPSGNGLTVADFFTPDNYAVLEGVDLDFGSPQTMLIPGTNRVLTGCKDGHLYLADVNHLGGFNANSNNVAQTINLGTSAHLRSSFGYYKGTANEFVYTWSENTALKAFPVNRVADTLDVLNVVTSGLPGPSGNSGANMAASSNGSVDSTAILWASHSRNGCDANPLTCPGILRAISATDVTTELWNSTINPADNVGNYAKFSCPTIANGKVYLSTFSNQLIAYGLVNNGVDTCNSPNIALNKTAGASSTLQASTPASAAFDGNETTYWASAPSDPQSIYVDLGARYNLCRVKIDWESAARDFDMQISDDFQNWTTVQSVRSNISTTSLINIQAAGRYVRMLGSTRVSTNYAIYEMQVFGTPVVTCVAPGGLQASGLQQNSATLSWNTVSGATGYTIQYKAVSDASWTTTTSTANSVQLSALSCATDYLYQVATHCTGGQTSAWSASAAFSTSTCTTACGPLPTRWTTSDIGSIGMAGQACFDGSTYSLQGSGADIGGTIDAFRFAYITLAGDEQFVVRVNTQDATDPANKAGIMIRENITPDARNAFITLTSGQGAVFQYRNTTGGATSSVTAGGIKAPYWLQLSKTGAAYTASVSPDGLAWTQLGTTVNAGFGSGSTAAYAGLAVTSHNNTVLSTATADNFSQATTIPLPIVLTSFSGQDTGPDILLQWSTSMEQNSDHFEVEKSNDAVHFAVAASLRAAGSSYVRQSYSAQDLQPADGINYYRLRLVYADGRFTLSPVILIRHGKGTEPLLFPNPAGAFFNVVAGREPIREIVIYDLAGRRLIQSEYGTTSTTFTVPCSWLTRGVYVVGIRTGTRTWMKKMIKN